MPVERETSSWTSHPCSGPARLARTVWLLLALWPAAAMAQSTSVNGQIAYVALGPSTIPFGSPTQSDIWVMDADGSNPVNLTDTTEVDELSPAWSADGRRIAYISDPFTGTLMIMNADGTGKAVVTTGASSPTWSPGGTQIAFVRSRDGLPVEIVVRDLQTGDEREVSGPVDFGGVLIDVAEMEPTWSPDGGKIAYTAVVPESYVDVVTGEPVEGAQYEIVTVNIDGTGRQVVSAGDPGSIRATYLEEDRYPAWSPDGSRLIFMSQAQVPSCCGPWQVWMVNRDGTNAANLTNDDTVNDMFPTWSPDGALVLFTRAEGSGWNLYTMPAPAAQGAPASSARLVAAAAATVTPLTSDGNAQNGVWGRDPGTDPPASFQLSVTLDRTFGSGGWVISKPAGIFCGRDCTQTFPAGTPVTLTAWPRPNSVFTGWSGACTGTARTCTISMQDVRTVRATFRRRPR